MAVPVQVSYKLVSYKKVCTALDMLTKLSNNRIDLLPCTIGPASHAFKKEVPMNGSNRILSATLNDDIIVTSSPGETSVHGLQGLDLSMVST